ncbi:NitT/TauT family transport system ATP-binding protein [Plasticicumulans lactativorans]|uniref:NitT/TauT family transport system ATP-binding protein n=1 Tax=Plasticicumulans lactativorans TaxID=1133106 RepID=A0A4V2SDG6_9GAMM|nr:ABC transporter ATP-binding protein [Plasticicumulans lactativorans]TCO83398.1 NitT/TauT family transport system ATP-binding protein [Plasticicumulans lactativorans]
MSGAALALEVRAKRWPGATQPLLAGLRLAVVPGEFVALVGPSGSGKSTLLGLAAGLDTDFDGRIERPPGAPGVVFQEPRLLPWLSALDNVRLVLHGADDERRARDWLAAMGLGEALGRRPGELSGGMQRRVALARAFAIAPRWLLLDEPFVSLDAPVAAGLRALLLEHWQATRALVLLVTHALDEALALADRVVFLGGRPARVLLDHRVGLPRPRAPAAVARHAADLLAAHPGLLTGSLDHG